MKFEKDRLPEPENEPEAIALIAVGFAWLYNHHGANNREQQRALRRAATRTAHDFITKVTIEGDTPE